MEAFITHSIRRLNFIRWMSITEMKITESTTILVREIGVSLMDVVLVTYNRQVIPSTGKKYLHASYLFLSLTSALSTINEISSRA